jgi:hypothetical protein
MNDVPDAAIYTRTGLQFGGVYVKIFIDDLLPNCNRCMVWSGHYMDTNETAFYAFCMKTPNALESVGPYNTYYEALKMLALTKGCVHCPLNRSPFKDAYLPFLDEKVREQMCAIYGNNQSVKLLMDSLNNLVDAMHYLDINFEHRFGFKLFVPLLEDKTATLNLIKTCNSATNFAVKLQCLANLLRLNRKELIKQMNNVEKEDLRGTLLILEQFFKEKMPTYPKNAISILRSAMSLRNIFPAHVTPVQVIDTLKVFGIDGYPLKNWDQGVSVIVNACADSLDKITTMIREK